MVMNEKAILSAVEKLHANASAGCKVKIKRETYLLKWNGRNYETTMPDGSEGPEWNTRKVSVARKWLKEYFE